MDTQASEILSAIGDMKNDIDGVKNDAETFKQGLDDTSPEDITYDGSDDAAGLDEDPSLSPEDKDKAKEIKTPEEAKKRLEEATKDISAVIEHLDGIGGQAATEEKEASVKRISVKYAANLRKFADEVDTIVADANNALKHWAYLLKIRRVKTSSIQDPSLRKAAQSMEDIAKLKKVMDKIYPPAVKTATAVPPDRSDFSGDKWGPNGNPALVENRAWEAGATEFGRDRTREDARPNPAVDDRLQDKGNPHDEKPFVNARFIPVKDNKFGSYWDIFDSKTKKRVIATFANLPAAVTPVKNDYAFIDFASKAYGDKVINHVLARGIGQVSTALAAQEAEPPLKVFAADKADLRKYYTDAYGSAEYAEKLTSGADNTKMETDYKPKDDHPASKSEETKDGPGKLSKRIDKLNKSIKRISIKLSHFQKTASTITNERGELLTVSFSNKLAKKQAKVAKLTEKLAKKFPNFIKKKKDKKNKEKMSSMTPEERALLKVKADKAIEISRRFAAVGSIPFTYKALLSKGQELLAMDDTAFKATVAVLNQMPITNTAALKESHIPDTEYGVVGNRAEGVSKPDAKVKTEDINPNVKADANINKSASIVPQMQASSGGKIPDLTTNFTTVVNKLNRLGVDPRNIKQPTYRQY